MQVGAHVVERNYSHYVAYAAKTILAVVGTATKGPIGEAVLCTSTQDFVNKFGPLLPECLGLYAGQYFLSQSSRLYFVRAAHTTKAVDEKGQVIDENEDIAIESSVEISGLNNSDTTVADAITIKSLEKGTYANGYTITISEGSPKKDSDGLSVDTYNLTIKSKSGNLLETIKNISIDELDTDYTSKYIKVSAVNNTAVSLTLDSYTLEGGSNGITDISSADYINASNALISASVDMNLFAVPGVSDSAVISNMLALAESRGDCLFLVDPPKGLTRDGVAQWHNGEGDYNHTSFNSSYGALYYDWLTIYDSYNKLNVEVPPSVVVAATYAYSDRTSEVWYAPAGLTRGLVRGALDTSSHLSNSDIEYLYSEGNSVNCIRSDSPVGLVLWGQKTLSRTDDALNRVNVRRLLNYLKRVISAACDYLTFEPNDRITWNSFKMKVEPVLESIQNKRGLYEYRIVRGEDVVTESDIDNYTMPCIVMIRPTKSAEFIPIYFTVTSTGADFNEVLESNGILAN